MGFKDGQVNAGNKYSHQQLADMKKRQNWLELISRKEGSSTFFSSP